MVDPLEALPGKVQTIENKLDALGASVEARFEAVDARFDEVTFALVEQRQYTDSAFERLRSEMTAGFRAMAGEFGRVERKIDQVIDRLTRPRSDP
jgi:hypothetical protein